MTGRALTPVTDRQRYTLSAQEAADYLSLALKTLYEKAEAGQIDHLRTSANVHTRMVNGQPQVYRKHGRLKFSYDGLDAWLAAHRVTVTAARPATARPAPRPMATLPAPARRRFA